MIIERIARLAANSVVWQTGGTILQITRDAFISSALSLEPGRICMISMYSQITHPCPMFMLDTWSLR
jgi:hypothetical protein